MDYNSYNPTNSYKWNELQLKMLELHPSTSPSSTHEARACHSSACARAVRQEVAVALEGQDVVVEVASQPRSVERNATASSLWIGFKEISQEMS